MIYALIIALLSCLFSNNLVKISQNSNFDKFNYNLVFKVINKISIVFAFVLLITYGMFMTVFSTFQHVFVIQFFIVASILTLTINVVLNIIASKLYSNAFLIASYVIAFIEVLFIAMYVSMMLGLTNSTLNILTLNLYLFVFIFDIILTVVMNIQASSVKSRMLRYSVYDALKHPDPKANKYIKKQAERMNKKAKSLPKWKIPFGVRKVILESWLGKNNVKLLLEEHKV